MRAVQPSNADLVFVAAYPPDTVGIVRSANEVGPDAKMFGGTMIGLLATPLKVQLGPLTNKLVIMESFVMAPAFNFPGSMPLLEKYRAKAKGQQIDPFGYGFVPFGYAAGQVLAKAVTETKSLDHDKIAKYIHANKFSTVAGELCLRQGRRMGGAAHGVPAVPRHAAERRRAIPRRQKQPILWPVKHKNANADLSAFRRKATENNSNAVAPAGKDFARTRVIGAGRRLSTNENKVNGG